MKRISILLLVCALVFLMLPMHDQVYAASNVWDGTVATRFAGGSGTSSNPYRIETGAQLAYLAKSVSSSSSRFVYQDTYFSLVSDIDLNGQNWTPIGDDDHYFCGTFAGNGHTISNLFINQSAGNNIGLFGSVYKAKISDIHLENAAVRGVENVGGLIGYMSGSGVSLTKCSVNGIVHGSEKTGGLVGNSGGSISDCTNFATVNGATYTGGISGWSSSTTITRCLNYGTIKASDYCCGGIAGYSGTITDCFNSGSVSGTSSVGGIAGDADSLTNCGNIGSVSGTREVGGLWGDMVSGSASYCYNAGSVSGTKSGALGGHAQSSSISNNYYQAGSSSSVLGSYPSSNYPNTMSNNQSVSNCASQSFANTLNSNLSVFDTPWTYDPTQYGGYPYIELRTVTKIQVSGENNLILYEGDTFDGSGLTINVAYDDGSKSTVSPSACIYSPNGSLSAGPQTISVTYGGKSTTIRVQVRSQSEYAETDWINCDTLRVSVTDVATGTTAIGAAYDKTGRLLETHVSSVNENGAVFFSFDEVKETALAKVFYVDSKYRPIRSDAQVSHTVGTGHVVVTNPAEAATCTMPGHTEGSYCSVCGKVLSEQTVIPALGHNFVNNVCTRCGDFEVVPVADVTLSQSSASLTVGASLTLNAKVTPVNAANQNIFWISSNPDVATVSASGVVTALTAGNTIITALVDGKSASCTVDVSEMQFDSAWQYLADFVERNKNGTSGGISVYYRTVNTSTLYLMHYPDENIVSVGYQGAFDGGTYTSLVIIPKDATTPYEGSYRYVATSTTTSKGSTDIYPDTFNITNPVSFTSWDGTEETKNTHESIYLSSAIQSLNKLEEIVFQSSPYTIHDLGFTSLEALPKVNSVSLDKTELSMNVGDTAQLTATVDPLPSPITWLSNDTSVLTISSTGEIQAVGEGTATITAFAADKYATCTVNVVGPFSEFVSIMKAKGSTSASGVITYASYDYTFTYSPTDKTIRAVYVDDSVQGTSITTTLVIPNDLTSPYHCENMLSISSVSPAIIYANLSPATFRMSSTSIKSYYASSNLAQSTISGMEENLASNMHLILAKINSTYIIYSNTSYRLKDLGFTSY